MKKKVFVLVGPTASGKTALSIALAKRLNGEIISADSMQIYQTMNIGTAKPTKEEMQGIRHHVIDCVAPDEPYSVARFKDDAEVAIESILKHNRTPIVVGGTGLYINGLTLPWGFESNDRDENVRSQLEERARIDGSDSIYAELQKVDPETASTIHPNNVKRVIRALEIFLVAGKTKSEIDRETQKTPVPYDYFMAGLRWNREVLYDRINRRIDLMIEAGLVDEVRMLRDNGYNADLVAMKAIGYKELFPYLDGEQNLEETIRILKRDTRHFAKRQLTWFRKDSRINWYDVDSSNLVENTIDKMINDWFQFEREI